VLVTPSPGQVLADARPVIAIAPDASRRGTWLNAEVRVPEKELLERIDAELGAGALRLPLDAPIYRATVKLALRATCGTGATSTATTRIHIDTGLACAAPREVAWSRPNLKWQRGDGADRTEVAILRADDARELRRSTTELASVVVDAPGGAIAVLRSHCRTGLSAPSFVLLQ
jgi:Arc/MetJ family transcription regulator